MNNKRSTKIVLSMIVAGLALMFVGAAPASAADVPYLRIGVPVEVKVDVYPGESFQGEIVRMGAELDPNTRTLEIEAEIDSQHTELMLELEWVELTAQMNGTVDNVKTLLWGGTDNRHELLDIGLEYTAEKQAFSDLYVH